MKYLILAVFGAGLVAGSAFYLSRSTTEAPSLLSETGDLTKDQAPAEPASVVPEVAAAPMPPAGSGPHQARPSTQRILPVNAPLDRVALVQAVDLLVSPQASYAQKQGTWQQLRERGCLDQAIAELEQRRSDHPADPESAAVLGHAYLQKCGTISDVREQGILAMQADKLFDAALSLDPSNWEARFTKAVALSYWPDSMGKGEEVIQHFTTLIQQQESQPPQPQFAEPYLWLGNQYQKAGQLDEARATWARGAGLFPNNQQLKDKLASQP